MEENGKLTGQDLDVLNWAFSALSSREKDNVPTQRSKGTDLQLVSSASTNSDVQLSSNASTSDIALLPPHADQSATTHSHAFHGVTPSMKYLRSEIIRVLA
eukprot:SAG31_NODE_33049_length_348_cov_1.032129_1_plen_100_part_10